MNKKRLIFSIFLVFIVVISIGAISAQDVDDTLSAGQDVDNAITTSEDVDDAISTTEDDTVVGDSEQTTGSVSGDVDVAVKNPWNTTGELDYAIPTEARTIQRADIYVDVYSGNALNTHGAVANITITAGNGVYNFLDTCWSPEGSKDGTVYIVNENITKCYSDFKIHHDLTGILQGLEGTNVNINVNTFQYGDKTFDGRIKLIALLLAYDDGDTDVINYVIDDNPVWCDVAKDITFNTAGWDNVLEATLLNIALSSSDGTYRVNGKSLTDPITHQSGNYYQLNYWDITDDFKNAQNTVLNIVPGKGWSGPSYQSALSVIKSVSGDFVTSLSLSTERPQTTGDIVYAGTYNLISVTVDTTKNGKYTVKLFDGETEIDSVEVFLTSGSKLVILNDTTIRDITARTVSTGTTGTYDQVTYTAKLFLNDELINTTTTTANILYNGYLSKEYAYNSTYLENFLNMTITGDIVVDISTQPYATGWNNRTDSWTVNLVENSQIVKAFVYVPYTWLSSDDESPYVVTFNGGVPSLVAHERDQANIYGTQGYGIYVYDVTDLIKAGENVFDFNKTKSVGTYQSILIYLYNTTGSDVIKNVQIYNGADLVGMTGNGANRTISVNSVFNVDTSSVSNAVLYLFGSGSTDNRTSIIINGERYDEAWNTVPGDYNQANLFTKELNNPLASNEVSIILNPVSSSVGFTALHQILVTTQKTASKITASAVTKVYNVNKNLAITLKDANNKAISKASVTIVLNGKTYSKTTDASGKISLSIPNLAPKTYTATIKYAGNGAYKAASASAKVTVKKATGKIIASAKTFRLKVKTKQYVITLKNNKNQVVKSTKVTLKVNGKTFAAKTNAKGKATFKINNLKKAKKYTATITFPANTYYNQVTKKVKITVKK